MPSHNRLPKIANVQAKNAERAQRSVKVAKSCSKHERVEHISLFTRSSLVRVSYSGPLGCYFCTSQRRLVLCLTQHEILKGDQ
jgi:hypothetical protein